MSFCRLMVKAPKPHLANKTDEKARVLLVVVRLYHLLVGLFDIWVFLQQLTEFGV